MRYKIKNINLENKRSRYFKRSVFVGGRRLRLGEVAIVDENALFGMERSIAYPGQKWDRFHQIYAEPITETGTHPAEKKPVAAAKSPKTDKVDVKVNTTKPKPEVKPESVETAKAQEHKPVGTSHPQKPEQEIPWRDEEVEEVPKEEDAVEVPQEEDVDMTEDELGVFNEESDPADIPEPDKPQKRGRKKAAAAPEEEIEPPKKAKSSSKPKHKAKDKDDADEEEAKTKSKGKTKSSSKSKQGKSKKKSK